MSAQEQMRAMLDELMGTARDGENSKYKVKFDDARVCKSFLLGCCPHDILSSTRMDLGECPKIHDLALRADYEQASRRKDYYYDIDAMEHLSSFIADCDRKTELAKRRLKETQEELSEEANGKVAEMIHKLGEEMGTKLAKAEDLGAEGLVVESLQLMEEVENLKKQKAAAEQEYRNSMPASSYQQQKLRVCEVCSAYLGIHDNDRRLADHFGGKLHLGFITIREKLEELKKSIADRRMQREKEREEQKLKRAEREKAEEEARLNQARSRSRSRKRTRSRSRDRKRRSRSRSRRSRSRSRSRHSRKRSKRSRSRSRSRRSRSRSRRRSRRSRSRSRSRSRKSRSRSRHKRRRRSRSRSHSKRSQSRERKKNGSSRSSSKEKESRSSAEKSP
ncbi:putative RNA-binding protein Luc7-like 1 isoform X1 [Saccostrea cucullata]|uniref:putative RNA-binding protein Luc7-like 1 isoform X1 n=2 Tax=Saccostrea cuccullata TaxID=36930 RepID=UPI002ED095FE